jgi:hypothetical protein
VDSVLPADGRRPERRDKSSRGGVSRHEQRTWTVRRARTARGIFNGV